MLGRGPRPGVEWSGTPGSVEYEVAAREVGDSVFILSEFRYLLYRTLSRAGSFLMVATWGSAPLHPRLYAIAALRGLRQARATALGSVIGASENASISDRPGG